MKDINIRSIPANAVYKDVVIIGNGPSGLALSYMLAGNWPYWKPDKITKHPDELLRARLNYADSNKSLVVQDLEALAEGLEGRSTNPVSLLLDSLEHPCADLGMELPSMLEYKANPNTQVDHIVLGKGPPGGSWHRMDPNLRTLSLAAWMSLPGYSFGDWEIEQHQKQESQLKLTQKPLDHRINGGDGDSGLRKQAIMNNTTPCEKCLELRTKPKPQEQIEDSNNLCLVNNNESEMGALCCKCTKETAQKPTILVSQCEKALAEEQTIDDDKNLIESVNSVEASTDDSLLKATIPVTRLPPRRNLSLKRQVSKEVQTRALVSRVAKYYEDYVKKVNLEKYFMNDTLVTMIAPIPDGCPMGKFKASRWIVYGFNKATSKTFCFVCKNVVLASGASDLPNRLGLRNEDYNVSWVKHELPQLESALEAFNDRERTQLKPVLVVGAGLSAADAVTICRSSDIPVIHVFRSRSAGLDKMLPENVYPEYHEVHRMMKDPSQTYENYMPLPEHRICDLVNGKDGVHHVTVEHIITGEQKTFEVSFCAILIGSRPDLRFTIPAIKCASLKGSPTSIIDSLNEKLEKSPEHLSIFGRKISWFKNICAKCKHLNICDWSRRNGAEYGRICNHVQGKVCDCNKSQTVSPETEVKTCPVDGSGLGLGVDPSKPIDCKSNQIAVDKYTYQVLRAPKGLYAMGPLVGDNFVRFIPGGALAITTALHKEND